MIRPEKITIVCTLVAVALLLATAIVYVAHAYQIDKGKTITSLWEDYKKSESADKPQTSLEILDKIKALALEKHLSWDYYDACVKYYEVTSRINWKQRDKAAQTLKMEIERFDDPVMVSYYYLNAPYGYRKSYNDIYKYVQDNKTRLSATSSQKFLQNIPWSKLSDVIKGGHFFKNDYQNILWILSLNGHRESFTELEKEYTGVYPQGAWLEYYDLSQRKTFAGQKRRDALKEYSEKYSSKAMSLFAKEDLLQNKFYDMESEKKTTSSQYKALRQECKEFIDLKNTFSKTEKDVASCSKEVESLISTLDSKWADVSIKDNVLSAILRNTSSVSVSLVKNDTKKTVWSYTVKNNINSYYVHDTVKVNIPDIDDGEYNLKYRQTEKESVELQYNRYSISVATRINNSGKYEIYAVDSKTGEPLESVSGLKLDGFTFIGSDAQDRLERNAKQTFVCKATSKTGKTLLSKELSKYDFTVNTRRSNPVEDNVVILTSAPAYKPGDDLDFKLIAYSSKPKYGDRPEMNVLSNKLVKVSLMDADGKLVEEKTILTNEFGAAADSFAIPTDRKNGNYHLEAQYSGLDCGFATVRVGEYELPSFAVIIDEIEGTVFVGETITFKGRVKSYSGKAVSSDKSTYTVSSSMGKTVTKPLEIDNNGSFSVDVKADKEGYYSFNVNVVDATGESKTASSSLYVTDHVYFDIHVVNGTLAEAVPIAPPSDIMPVYRPYRRNTTLIESKEVIARFSYSNRLGVKSPATIDYTVLRDGKKVASGQAWANETVTIALDSSESGQYTIEAVASVTSKEGKTVKSDKVMTEFVKVIPEATAIDFPIEYIIMPSKDGIGFRLGTTNGDIWAIATVVSSDGKILKDESIHIDGKKGEKGSIIDVKFDAESSWSESVQVNLNWFKNHTFQSWNSTFNVPKKLDPFKVEFSSFTDRTTPSKATEFTLKVPVGSETAVSVYDKALETISHLRWRTIDKGFVQMVPVHVGSTCGSNSTSRRIMFKSYAAGAVSKAAARIPVLSDDIDIVDDDVLVMNLSRSEGLGVEVMDYVEEVNEEAIVEEVNDEVNLDEINLRDSFDEVIAFEPFLYPDENGNVTFTVTPTGKLSTFIVKTYTHDKNLSSVISEKELVVSIPVELSIAEPQFLYVGDKYVLNASVSANSEVSVKSGTMTLTVFDGKDRTSNPISKTSKAVNFDASGLASASFEIASVPECNSGELGLMVTFSGKNDSGESISDGELVSVPVYKTEKMMTESHSAIYRPGMDKAAVISILSSQFTNLSSKDATVSERKISDLIGEVLDAGYEPKNDDAISLMEAIQVRMLSAKLSGKTADCSNLVSKLMECRNSDGGFAWRKDLESSEMVTLYVLQGAAMLKAKGISISQFFDLSSAVKFIDNERTNKKHYWYGSSIEQYCYIRSLYSDVKMSVSPSKEFKEEVKKYLTPKDESSFKGEIISKVRRSLTLDNLSSSESGTALAKEWGITLSTSRKLSKTHNMDMESVRQYAVDHASGGKYFPNAVMPYRGLLESELYAHTLICEMFRNEDFSLSDDIRLWLMIQKETQQWKSDPTTVLAVAAIMDGSKSLLETSVITLTSTGMQQFKEIKATANGFTINTAYYRKDGSKWVKVNAGETLHIGDKVKAVHSVHSDENRSFVKMVTSRPACLKPDSPISGRYGWRLYRDVRRSSTEWWWDALSEESTSYEEYFTVSQEGVFQSSASVIECLYSPSWRANENARPDMKTAF